jgi:hypothetical protein
MKSNKLKLSAIVFYTVIIALALGLPNMAFAGTIHLPKTGQTKCYDTANNQIPCDSTGQDGDLQAGVVWPNPRFNDNGDGTITDNLTNLAWASNGNLMLSRDPSFDSDGKVLWSQAFDYIAKLNNENYLGHSDWRLPNVNELESLINSEVTDNSVWLNNQGFINVQYGYWSSTTLASRNVCAFAVNLQYGDAQNGYKTAYGGGGSPWHPAGNAYVWPVRTTQNKSVYLPNTGQTVSYATGDDGDFQIGVAWPVPRFYDNDDATITDNLTGLMWTQNANLPSGAMTWQQALDYVKTVSAGGYTDWRLPNEKELRSICDYSQYNPAIQQSNPFFNVLSAIYWTSTTYAGYPLDAWTVYMDNGYLIPYDKSSNIVYVWPVRTVESIQTVIKLSSFIATPKAGKVVLQWDTESEIDNDGFNLYRSDAENGNYIKINTTLITVKGSSTQGASYEFTDTDVQNRKTYYYKLEDIDLNGKSTMHSPVSATPRLIYGIGK